MMGGEPGDDITSESIGLPSYTKPLEHIKAMNYYMKRAFDRDLTVAQRVPTCTQDHGSFAGYRSGRPFHGPPTHDRLQRAVRLLSQPWEKKTRLICNSNSGVPAQIADAQLCFLPACETAVRPLCFESGVSALF